MGNRDIQESQSKLTLAWGAERRVSWSSCHRCHGTHKRLLGERSWPWMHGQLQFTPHQKESTVGYITCPSCLYDYICSFWSAQPDGSHASFIHMLCYDCVTLTTQFACLFRIHCDHCL